MITNKVVGTFSVVVAYNIENIGFVVAGDIERGELNVGANLVHPSGNVFRVTGVEFTDVDRSKGIAYPAAVLDSKSVRESRLLDPESWLNRRIQIVEQHTSEA